MAAAHTWVRNLHWVVLAALQSACTSGWEPAFQEQIGDGHFDEVEIADADEALTFARVESGGARRVLAVEEYRGGEVHGVDLGTAIGREVSDPIPVFHELGYERLRDLLREAPASAAVSVAATSLIAPVDLRDCHIAAATNFPEHAGDAGVENGPFLFPKLVEPTGPYDDVSAGSALLDYEVEVAWVTLAPLRRGDHPEHMGLILANDFTDRDTLLHRIDPWNVESGDGFATGKSFPGYLPVGNLLIVPRRHRDFVARLELRLYVNGGLRQRSPARAMIWDFDEIMRRTWAWSDRRWDHRGAPVSLPTEGALIPDRTLILSGTPHGTIFAGLRPRHYATGLGSWLLGGWSEPLPSRVVTAYVDDARNAGAYLRAGDRVEIHVDRMGVARNPIVP